jgi:hypothetical protein
VIRGNTGAKLTSGCRVGPVDFVCLSNLHRLITVLPFIRLGELLVVGVVVLALESKTIPSEFATFRDIGWAGS